MIDHHERPDSRQPTERTEPIEPMDSTETCDQSERREPSSGGLIGDV
jgi:hypothetical protein